MRTEVNCSRKDEYYTQRNNRHYPVESCFATAVATKLANQNIPIVAPDGNLVKVGSYQNIYNKQPEDYLTELLCSKEAREFFESRYKKEPKNDEQRFYYSVVAYVTNELLCKKSVVEYKKNVKLSEVLFSCLDGIPVVLGGKFTKKGHMVCVVGFETAQDDILDVDMLEEFNYNSVTHVIVDDPYGDWYTQYTSHKGNDVRFEVKTFEEIVGRKVYAIV